MKGKRLWAVVAVTGAFWSLACKDESATPVAPNGDPLSARAADLDSEGRLVGSSETSDTQLSSEAAQDLASRSVDVNNTLPTGAVEAVSYGNGSYGEETIGYRGGVPPAPGEPGAPGAGALGAGGASFSILSPIQTETGNVVENPYAPSDSLSTFSVDSDTASYVWSRASVEAGELPPQDIVRVEDFLNYFDFHYAPPTGDDALSVYTELGECPWDTRHDLLLVGMKARELDFSSSPPAHLVFLVDVSGSMTDELPLVKAGLRSLSYSLRAEDILSIVTYAGDAGTVLEAAPGDDSEQILAAIDGLSAGGSTAGAAGIQLAYEIAEEHFIEGGTNRVLLSTDGDFNVGISSTRELTTFIGDKRASGVFLSVFGFGMATSGFSTAETLAQNGNGIFVYIDTAAELKRALGHALTGVLLTVATDVKLQVAFNPDQVKGYRLIGYENRLLSEDLFLDDLVDAGDLGAGLTSTALFEIVRADASEVLPDPISGTVPEPLSATVEGEPESDVAVAAELSERLAEVRLRYLPAGEEEVRQEAFFIEPEDRRAAPTVKFLFAAGMSHFAQRLRGSQYLGHYEPTRLIEELETALPFDSEGAVEEAIDFVRLAHDL